MEIVEGFRKFMLRRVWWSGFWSFLGAMGSGLMLHRIVSGEGSLFIGVLFFLNIGMCLFEAKRLHNRSFVYGWLKQEIAMGYGPKLDAAMRRKSIPKDFDDLMALLDKD